jgi:acetyl esterase/lipase
VLADEVAADDPLLSEMVVVTVPGEHSFPQALEALRWLAEHAADLDAAPERLVVAGGSGAACLAAAACEAGWPPLHRQVLVHPRFSARHPMPSAVAGVAPATIAHGGGDWEDGVRYAAHLRRAGVEVEEHRR